MAKILIVDDSLINRKYLSLLLSFASHRVVEAADGAEALTCVREQRPDLVVTDVLMPTMDGFEFVRRLRSDPGVPRMPVIFYTATYRADEAERMAQSYGADAVLPKPCDPQVILDTVQHLLGMPAAEPAPRDAATAPAEGLREAGSGADPVHLQRLCGRLSAMVDLSLELAGQREPEALLSLLLEGSRRMVPARHVGLGVLHPREPGRCWARGLGVDMSWFADGAAALPELLAAVEREGRPLRVSAAQRHSLPPGDLPQGLPPIGSFLALPLATPGKRYGWLFFARAPGEEAFNGFDEQTAVTLASAASQVYENALLYDLVQRHAVQMQQEAARREISERAYQRLNRVHAMRSRINAQIVLLGSRQALFEEVCRTAIEEGRFCLAWIGVSEAGIVEPVAWSGQDQAYVELVRKHQRAGSHTGPAVHALSSRQNYVANDVGSDPAMAQWREAAAQRGFRSMAALPLFWRDQIIGCLCVYAGERGFFNEDEMRLLSGLSMDISHGLEFIARQDQVDFLSYYDPLTRLANQRLFIDRLNQHVLAARQGGGRFAVLLVDIEKFRLINDALGTAGGDQVLINVAERLVRFAGDAGYLARVAGDRFAALIPDLRDVSDLATKLQDRVWSRLGRPVTVDGRVLPVSAKVGLALYPNDGATAHELYSNAEAALKNAKTSGERYLFYRSEMDQAMKRKLELEGRLRQALAQNEFELHYQPKLDLRSGRICGAEALLRWRSPELGLVPPGQFIPMMEETGLIVQVGRWAIQHAMEQRLVWLRGGLPAPRIAVNVSAVQLRRRGFVDEVAETLAQHGEHVDGLELEITESMLMSDTEANIDTLHRLRDLNVTISLDDFGTGYSSLAYLAKLPLNVVKIDRSFIVRMPESSKTMGIVSTIVALARSMDLEVVAEGVETREQLRLLRLLHCDQMQGFLFHRGLPAAEFAALLAQNACFMLD